jgi:mRNA interferase MazF
VVSPRAFFDASRFAIVCPVTRTVRNFGSSVILSADFPIAGEVLTSHVRSIDTLARPIRFSGSAVSAHILEEVRAKLAVLCGI